MEQNPLDAGATRVERILVGLVAGVVRRPEPVLAVITLLTVLLGAYAATHLGVNTDNKTTMLAEDLPFQQRARAFEELFPVLDDSILLVIDGESAEAGREASQRLAAALEARPDVARSVFPADADPFFEEHALLYRSIEELETFSDQLVRFQPVLGELSQNPDLATLSHVINQALAQGAGGQEELAPLLDGFGEATVAVYEESPLRISWQDLLLRESSFRTQAHSILIVDPVLDFNALLPAGPTLSEIRNIAAGLGIASGTGVDVGHELRLRITGYPALNDEEMRGLALDVGVAGVFSFLVVLGVLGWAFRSFQMVLASAITLIVGLVWCAAFGAFAVGRLNVVSIAFAVLFIGLGVDFAIHLGLHVLERRREGEDHATAFAQAIADVGPALLLCAVTTAVGFFSFIPTDYKGVAELGLISGTGMFVIFGLTLTLFPALLTRGLPMGDVRPAPRQSSRRAPPAPILVLGLAAGAALLAVPAARAVRFDSNVVKIRNPESESVTTWNDLLASGSGSPWYIDVLGRDLDEASQLAAKIEELELVSETRHVMDFVPTDQEDKLLILEDLVLFLDVPTSSSPNSAAIEPEQQIEALRSLHATLAESELWRAGSVSGSVTAFQARLGTFLERVERERDPAPFLEALEKSLLERFPDQLKRLQVALDPSVVTLADLPERLRERMLAKDGTARLQVFPTRNLDDNLELVAFVAAVRDVVPEATGLPVNLVEFAKATSASLRSALTIATGAIATLLLLLWRRPGDAVLALAPLLLAGLWTVGIMGAVGLPFNFVNVVVLPLLLGMGIDSGIHLVRRARTSPNVISNLAATTTGRAVFLSSFTTLASFGSLASSAHLGVSSMGVVLVIGMTCSLAASLGVLPAWLSRGARTEPAQNPAGESPTPAKS
ncbi:MAG: MMPL family transporter [Deltaproteobacteria bacterium]|nr:MMPL family transporter [Deltaproteobacteria bacterium]MBW2395665.1 MMPL family transporter [Deltaproteobacteria bacterium]